MLRGMGMRILSMLVVRPFPGCVRTIVWRFMVTSLRQNVYVAVGMTAGLIKVGLQYCLIKQLPRVDKLTRNLDEHSK